MRDKDVEESRNTRHAVVVGRRGMAAAERTLFKVGLNVYIPCIFFFTLPLPLQILIDFVKSF